MKVLIIIPAYNEELNIKKAVEDVISNTNYDYLVIDDCSKDGTKKICQENNYNYISLPINYGLTSGIQLGMKYAHKYNYDIVIQFDGDGQHQAKYLPDLVHEIENGYDITIGSRFINKKKPKTIKMLGSMLLSIAIKITTAKTIKDPTSGMRAYNKLVIEKFVQNASLTPEPDTLVYMLKKKFKIKEIQVEIQDRKFGKSYLSPIKSIEYMVNMFFSIIFIRSFTKK